MTRNIKDKIYKTQSMPVLKLLAWRSPEVGLHLHLYGNHMRYRDALIKFTLYKTNSNKILIISNLFTK